MVDYDTKENIKEHNPKWEEIPDHPYIILIIGSSGFVGFFKFVSEIQQLVRKSSQKNN